MIKKKRFGVSDAISQGLSDTIKMVENNTAEFRNSVIPLSRIELDPENPRKLALSPKDVEEGIDKNDLQYDSKNKELDGIIELSKSIKDTALLHPIIVYKSGEKYRIVAGERRFLATLLLQRGEIEARVFHEKPTGFKQKLVQWFENNSRENLSLYEKIENIRSLTNEYQALHQIEKISCETLIEITGLSKSQAANYLVALNLSGELYACIKTGRINSLKKVIEITKIKNPQLRKKAIDSCASSSTLVFLRSLVEQDRKHNTVSHHEALTKRGRSATKVNMGFTDNKAIIRKMIYGCIAVMNNPKLTKQTFHDINWDVYEDLTKAFRRLVMILESEE